jgi:hypothetical protein
LIGLDLAFERRFEGGLPLYYPFGKRDFWIEPNMHKLKKRVTLLHR